MAAHVSMYSGCKEIATVPCTLRHCDMAMGHSFYRQRRPNSTRCPQQASRCYQEPEGKYMHIYLRTIYV